MDMWLLCLKSQLEFKRVMYTASLSHSFRVYKDICIEVNILDVGLVCSVFAGPVHNSDVQCKISSIQNTSNLSSFLNDDNTHQRRYSLG